MEDFELEFDGEDCEDWEDWERDLGVYFCRCGCGWLL